MTTIESDIVAMIYELSEILYHEAGENSFGRERILELRDHIRDKYDSSVYEPSVKPKNPDTRWNSPRSAGPGGIYDE
jgi:hypothetical protein